MMGQSSGLRLWQTVSDLPIDKIAGPQKDCLLLQQLYGYERVPEVRRIIFIATPHRGSPLASASSATWDRGSATVRARSVRLARGSWLEMMPTHSFPFSTGKTRRVSASWPKDIRSWRPFASWGSIRRCASIRSLPTFATRRRPARPTVLFLFELPSGTCRVGTVISRQPHLFEQSCDDPRGAADSQGTRRNRPSSRTGTAVAPSDSVHPPSRQNRYSKYISVDERDTHACRSGNPMPRFNPIQAFCGKSLLSGLVLATGCAHSQTDLQDRLARRVVISHTVAGGGKVRAVIVRYGLQEIRHTNDRRASARAPARCGMAACLLRSG